MRLAVRRVHPAAILPAHSYGGDAGFDLHAVEEATLGPGDRASVRTGIAIEVPERHAGLVLLIDAGYRGEIRVLLLNTT